MTLYYKHDNMIFWGEISPLTNMPRIVEAVVNNQWKAVTSQTMMDAGFFGEEMTDEEATAFQGEGWPEEGN
jgi:hypothetical protein